MSIGANDDDPSHPAGTAEHFLIDVRRTPLTLAARSDALGVGVASVAQGKNPPGAGLFRKINPGIYDSLAWPPIDGREGINDDLRIVPPTGPQIGRDLPGELTDQIRVLRHEQFLAWREIVARPNS